VKRNPSLPRAPRTFVIRVLADGEASQTTLHGQISEPTAEDDWHATFASAEACWALMQGRLEIKLRRRNSRFNSKIRPHTTERTHA
jgi:hypothetical protein